MESLRNKAYRTLRRSEGVIKTDMVYLAKGGFWTTLRFGIGLIASIATIVAFGNLLPREVYGTYSYLLSLASSLSFLTLTGMSTGIIRAVARGQEEVLPYAMRLQLKYNLLAALTIALAGSYYAFKGNNIFALGLFMLAAALPTAAAYHAYESVFIGRKRFDLLAMVTTLITITSAGSTILTLLLTDNVLVLVMVFALTTLVPNIVAYRYVKRSLPKKAASIEANSEIRNTAFHLTGAGIISTLAQYLDKIVLFQVAGPAALAVYGFAIAGPEKLKGLVKNWTSIALPKLAERSIGEIRAVFYKRIGFAILAGLILSGAYILLSPFLFRLFLPRYLDSIIYSQAYSLGIIIIPALIYVGSVFYAQNMLRAVYFHSIGSQALRIALFVIFGWLWQTWGLVLASIASYCASAIYSVIIWELESRRKIRAQ